MSLSHLRFLVHRLIGKNGDFMLLLFRLAVDLKQLRSQPSLELNIRSTSKVPPSNSVSHQRGNVVVHCMQGRGFSFSELVVTMPSTIKFRVRRIRECGSHF